MIDLRMKRILLCAVLVVCLVVVPVTAAGGSSVLDAYGSNAAKVTIKVKGAEATTKGPSTVTQSSAVAPSTLPFTGTDLTLFLVAGTSLLLLGAVLRRLGRDKSR
jgi:hypothetical protein